MTARRLLQGLSLFAAVFAFGLVMFGAFVRLSDAGLSCPDWPTCYGQASWPTQTHEITQADAAFPERPAEPHKAWREQVHRMLAGGLGVMVLVMALAAAWQRRWARVAVIAAALSAAIGVGMYMRGEHVVSSFLAAAAMALPVTVAWRLRLPGAWRIAILTLAVIVFQAMLGMWTVTLLLKPIVVMGHLLGGMATFGLLVWTALRLAGVGAEDERHAHYRRWVLLGIGLLAMQIALGGWTSSNYAALACGFGDAAFPKCLGQWWPAHDFGQGFVLWRGIGVDYEGGVLDLPARTAIQMAHRLGALVVACYLGWLAWRSRRERLGRFGLAIALLLLTQIGLGIGNVHFGLPLPVATLHNGVAALLLASLLAALARAQARPRG
ncbi:MAG TPA: COX15/CtaA family protein [Rhodanobacteraceae bacterium]|nr:COX15/CtaA family protein [Rhodanobacteraceae bacterium]